MSSAIYHLNITRNGKTLIALPYHNSGYNNTWEFPEALRGERSVTEAYKNLFEDALGVKYIDYVQQNSQYRQIIIDGYIYYIVDIELKKDLPEKNINTKLRIFDKTTNKLLMNFIKFKWIPTNDLIFWLANKYYKLNVIKKMDYRDVMMEEF